jgi:hypothetical protein
MRPIPSARFNITVMAERPVLAGDCLPPLLDERLLTRKLPLKLDESATIYDPNATLNADLNHRDFTKSD